MNQFELPLSLRHRGQVAERSVRRKLEMNSMSLCNYFLNTVGSLVVTFCIHTKKCVKMLQI